MPRLERVSLLSDVPGIGIDRMGTIADALRDPEELRLENLYTDMPPSCIAIEATCNVIGNNSNISDLFRSG